MNADYVFTGIDYAVFITYFAILSFIGLYTGRKKKKDSTDYFLASRSLPWYAIGGSFVATNISIEHFIGMVGAVYIYGICVALNEWRNIWVVSMLVWFFIPFLIASKTFTIPEFLERRFNIVLRQFFALVTILCNITAFLAAVLYGGGLILEGLFGWNLYFSIAVLAVVTGTWAIYGGLRSVVWMGFFTVIIMIIGGILVTLLGLYALSGKEHSLVVGIRIMIERNQAQSGIWRAMVETVRQQVMPPSVTTYNRMALIQPISHPTHPWPFIVVGFLSVGVWYNVLNQFMIQRVLAAKNMYHARMGIVFSGFLKTFVPVIVVVPGLILFAMYPEVLGGSWRTLKAETDRGFIRLVQELVPLGFRGLILAALFGAIQSTVDSVLNSTATVFTLDIFKRILHPKISQRNLARIGFWSSIAILLIAVGLASLLGKMKGFSLFVYIQSLYAFFAPPFSAIFILGILWKRINATGATITVFIGFAVQILVKIYVLTAANPAVWIRPYEMQAILNWAFCVVLCIVVSLLTAPPRPDQVKPELCFTWGNLNLLSGLGDRWYKSVVFWWAIFTLNLALLILLFCGLFF